MYINKLTRLVNVVWFSCQLFQFFYSARPDWSLNVLVPHTFLLQNFHLLKSTHIMVIVKKPEMDKKNQGNEKKKIAEDHWRPEINHQRFHSFHIFVFFAVGRCNLSLGISVVQKKKHFKFFPPKSVVGDFIERRTSWIASWTTSSTSSSSWTVRDSNPTSRCWWTRGASCDSSCAATCRHQSPSCCCRCPNCCSNCCCSSYYSTKNVSASSSLSLWFV